MSYSKKPLTALSIVFCLSFGAIASAEHILFSQYDGKSTWSNTYVDVDIVRDHIWRGGIFFDAVGRSSRPATPAVPGTPEIPWSSDTITRLFIVGATNSAISEQIYSKSSASATFYDKLTKNLYNNTNTDSATGVPSGGLIFVEEVDITDPNASVSDSAHGYLGKVMQSYSTAAGTSYSPEVAGTAAIPARDRDDRPAHLLVKVPKDADVPTFIEAFMSQQKE